MTRKIVTALLSLVVAIALWSYVVKVVGPEYQATFHDIEVGWEGRTEFERKNLMLLTEETPTVTLELSGNRSELNKLSSSNISVTVDLSKIELPGKNTVSYNVDFPLNVSKENITIQSGTPSGITVEIARSATKEVPVQVYFEGVMPDDYIKEKPVHDEFVVVSGPEDVINKIETARVCIPLNESSTTTIRDQAFAYVLCDAEKEPVNTKYITAAAEESTVNVTMEIKRVKEVPLLVNVIEGGGASEENTTIAVNPPTIQVSGDEEILANLEFIELGTVDLSQIADDTLLTFDITAALKDGVANETGITEAQVTVDFRDLYTKTFYATNFNLENVPANMAAAISNVQIKVDIRGPQSVVNKLDPANIIVNVDCAEATLGSNRLDAVITIKGYGSQIGAVGTYTVLVQAEEKGRSVTPEE